MQGYRHPHHQLRDMDADLADEFDRVSRDLKRHAMTYQIEPPPPGFYDRQTETHRILSKSWDEVVQRIKQIDGFTDFLQAEGYVVAPTRNLERVGRSLHLIDFVACTNWMEYAGTLLMKILRIIPS
jgi:hypothetical protein